MKIPIYEIFIMLPLTNPSVFDYIRDRERACQCAPMIDRYISEKKNPNLPINCIKHEIK